MTDVSHLPLGHDYEHVKALELEIQIISSRIQPHDCGHLHTTVSVLRDRVCEIMGISRNEYEQLINTNLP